MFVTGTDDGVGKTYVCALLAARARAAGLTPAMLTAVQIGEDDATRWLIGRVPGAVGATAHVIRREHLLASRGGDRDRRGRSRARARGLPRAARPQRRRARRRAVRPALADRLEPHDGRSRPARSACPLVIVCRPGRGTINHAALTLEAARRRNLAVQGLIVNGADEPPGARGARQPRRARAPRADPRDHPGRDDQLALGRRRSAAAVRAGAGRVARGIAEVETQTRGHAGRQPEAEAVEPRGARPARHDDARAGAARARCPRRTAAPPGTPCARARGGARGARRAGGGRA